jgi:rare lipoprotein A (peptidoglycan hydrolase)
MSDDTERRHEALRQENGPTSRRWHALRRLRALAGRYRTRYWAAAALAGLLGAAFALSVAGVFESKNETSTLGTGRAGVMAADSARTADSARGADVARPAAAAPAADSTQARTDPTQQAADSLARGEKTAAEADNTGVVEGAAEEIAEVVGRGKASYYGSSLAGNSTASGDPFDPSKLTAAHRTLPLGSRVRVTNLRNEETVTVRINDRGPFHGNRVLDLSRRAAERIGMLARGQARVKIELLE